ncbi:hypothetical protein [Curtobacterium sp. L1-20]|uniref:hypothetical protein n=1 Tax=Curtobacterium sp. L1-20 TaxID=3138181 RepID=UPI003B52138F
MLADDLDPSLHVLLEEDGPSEDQDRLTARAVRTLRDLGALRAGVPVRWGGSGAPFDVVSDGIVRLGTVAGAAAWVAALAYGSNLAGALLSEHGQEELWASDADAHVCGSFSPSGTARPTGDGYVVDAVVETVSGIHSAGWLMAMVLVQGTGQPVLVFVPVAAVDVVRTWAPSGLRGSGSDRAVVAAVTVPAHRVIAVEDFVAGMGRWGLPVDAFGPALLAAPLVGLAAGAVDLARRTLRGEATGATGAGDPSGPTGTSAPKNPPARAARADVRAAYTDAAIAADRARTSSEAARAVLGASRTEHDPAAVRRSVTATVGAVQEAALAGELATVAIGSAALQRGHRANRVWRDLQTGSRHTLFTPRALPARYLADLPIDRPA